VTALAEYGDRAFPLTVLVETDHPVGVLIAILLEELPALQGAGAREEPWGISDSGNPLVATDVSFSVIGVIETIVNRFGHPVTLGVAPVNGGPEHELYVVPTKEYLDEFLSA